MKYVVLSFDDGREDFYNNVFPFLSSKKIPSTLNVITGYSDNSIYSPFNPVTNLQIKEMNQNNVEIAIHGDSHLRSETYNDLDLCFKKIYSITDKKPAGIAMPYAQFPNKEVKKFIKDRGIAYTRLGYKKVKHSIFLYLYYRFKTIKMNDSNYISHCLITACKKNKSKPFVYSCEILNERTEDFYSDLIQILPDNYVITFMFHSILDKKEMEVCDYKRGAWDKEKFYSFINNVLNMNGVSFIKQKDLYE